MVCMNIVSINPNIQGGTPCFIGTRVPVASLFDYLDRGHSTAKFLSEFPTVKESQVHTLLEQARNEILGQGRQAATQ